MSGIQLKTAAELALMRQSGQLLAEVFADIDQWISPGLSTMESNRRVEAFIVNELHARPASKGQYNYPYVLNSSLNEVVCHGMPSDAVLLKDGDIINLDITLEKHGFIADSSKMYLIGQVSAPARQLVDTTYLAMWQGIQAVKPGARLGDIGFAIGSFARARGYSVVRDYCGHGIGREMHEEPQILHDASAHSGLLLREGMTFTIEPMINQGTARVKQKRDGWTVVTQDKKLSAQWEHTIAVTADGYEVLTLRQEEREALLLSAQPFTK